MTSCRIASAVTLLSLILTVSVMAEAQQSHSTSNASIASVNLLSSDSVQMELRLNPEQKAKLEKVRSKLNGSLRSIAMGEVSEDAEPLDGGAGDGVVREEDREEDRETRMLRQMGKLDSDARTVLQTLLSESQQRRLREISLQSRGPSAFSDPEVTRQLQLTQGQQQQLAKIQSATSKQRLDLYKNIKTTPPQERAKILQQLRSKETRLKYAVLTSEQRALFQRMMGRKIQLNTNKAARFMNNS